MYTEKDFPQFSGCVLIVEDMQANIAVARGLIEKMGFEILEAVNGEIAVQQWQKHRPDLILMDLHMPVMDGLTAMRAIRHIEKNDPLNRSTPIFALTADAHAERLADVERAGGDGLIAKPFKKGDLVRLFKQYFHQQESSRDVKLSHESDKNEEGIGTDKVVLDQAVLDELKLVLGADLEILFQAFFSDAEGIIETLKNASEESVDLTAIARAAHSMKSISQNLGGRDLSALAERIEKAAKQEEVQEVCALITLLIKEYTLFSEALNKER
ncbi:response regulator [Marinomonas sp.]|uniref:response regulator n=1 Tax=Marinomonas sp. TaxID=1904862 RepID=UPI003F9BA32E